MHAREEGDEWKEREERLQREDEEEGRAGAGVTGKERE